METPFNKRKGIINASIEFYYNLEFSEMYNYVRIEDVKFDHSKGTVTLVCWSPLFDKLREAEETPQYSFTFKKGIKGTEVIAIRLKF